MRMLNVPKTLWNDYASMLLAISGPILTLVGVMADAFGFLPGRRGRGGFNVDPDSAMEFIWGGLALTVVLMIFLVIRLTGINKLLKSGAPVQGRILSVDFFKDRGRVEYEYTAFGKLHQSGTGLHKNAQTQALAAGSEIDLLIDPQNPKRVIIADLYSDPVPGR